MRSPPRCAAGGVCLPCARDPLLSRARCRRRAPTSHPPPPCLSLHPQQASGGSGSGGAGGEKKRKRVAAADAFSEAQAARLAALFAEDEYASTARKQALADELGVELAQARAGGRVRCCRRPVTRWGEHVAPAVGAWLCPRLRCRHDPAPSWLTHRAACPSALPVQVNKWFEKQRKKQRAETGQPAKRGRPSAKSAGAGGGAAAATAVPAEGEPAAQPTPAPQQQRQQGEQQQQQQQQQQQAEGMDVDQAPAAEAAAAAEADATPAPAARTSEQAQQGSSPAGTAASPGAGAVAPAASAGAAAPPAKTPASAPQQRIISADEKVALVAELEAEVLALRAGGLAPALQPLPAQAGEAGAQPPARVPLSDARLAAAVAGQRAPLSRLVQALLPAFRAPDSDAPVDGAVLRRCGRGSREGGGWQGGAGGCRGWQLLPGRLGAQLLPSTALSADPCDALRCAPHPAAASWTWRPARASAPRMVRGWGWLAGVQAGRQCGWRSAGRGAGRA